MRLTQVPECACPVCKHRLDRATDPARDNTPRPKDLSVCLYCAAILEMDEALQPRQMTPAEVQALPADTLAELVRLVRLVRQYQRETKSVRR